MPSDKKGVLKQINIAVCDGQWSFQNEIADKQCFLGLEMTRSQTQWKVSAINRVGNLILKVSKIHLLQVSAVKHFKEKSTCIFSNDFKSVKLNKIEFWKKLQVDYRKMRYSAAQSRKLTAHENKCIWKMYEYVDLIKRKVNSCNRDYCQ